MTLEPVRGGLASLTSPQARTGGQALLVGLMIVAFLVLVVARTSTPSGPAGVQPSGSLPAVAASVQPSDAPATRVPAASPSAIPATERPTSSASPSQVVQKTYKVKSGDTLSSIAAKFGITVKALKKANGLSGTNVIHKGDVLVIPAR